MSEGSGEATAEILEAQLGARTRQLEALAGLGQWALAHRKVQELNDRSVVVVAETLGVEVATILERLPDHAGYLYRAGFGWDPEEEQQLSEDLASQADCTVRTGEGTVIVADLAAERRFPVAPALVRKGMAAGASVVIDGASGGPYGVLAAHSSQPHAFSGNDVSFLRAVASILAAALQREAAEAALLETERRFRQVTDAVPEMIWTTTPEGVPDYFNRRWYELTGLSEVESLAPGGWQKALHPDDAPRAAAAWRAAVGSGRPFEVEVRYMIQPSGEARWQLVRALPGRDHEGRIERWYGSVTDIDEQRRAEQSLVTSEMAYRTLAENLPALVYRAHLEKGRRMTFFNDLVEELTGYAAAELPTGEVCQLMPLILDDDRELVESEVLAAVAEGRDFEVEYRVRHRDGEVRTFHERGRAVNDASRTPGFIDGVIFDVTRRRAVEAELRQAHDELELRVAARTAELAESNQALRHEVAEREQVEERLRSHGERLEILHELDLAVLTARVPEETARELVDKVRQLVPCQRAAVVVTDEKRAKGEVLAVWSERATNLGEGFQFDVDVPFRDERPVIDRVFLARDLAATEPASDVTRALLGEGIRGHLAVPLVAKNALLGFLTLGSEQPGAFSEDTVELARQVAASLAVALHNARLFAELKRRRTELQNLLFQLVEVRDDERRRVAGALHDDAAQSLTSLMLGLGLLEEEVGDRPPARERIAGLRRTVGEVLERLHELGASLRSAVLDRLGLPAALRQVLDELQRQAGLRGQLTVVGDAGLRLEQGVEAMLFSVVRQALADVASRADASTVGVIVDLSHDPVQVIIEDDGRSELPEGEAADARLGTIGLRDWADMVGGSLTVERLGERGTTVFLKIPRRVREPAPDVKTPNPGMS